MDHVTLIYKVLAGDATVVEQLALKRWLADREANIVEFEEIKGLLEKSVDATRADRDEFYQGWSRIQRIVRIRRRRRNRRRWGLVCILVVLLSAVIVIMIPSQRSKIQKFDNEPLAAVIPALERAYGIKIEVGSVTLLRCRYSGTFYNVPAAVVVNSLSASLNVSCVETAPGRYYLDGKGCQ